ncbi:alanyl-tRNA synthetase [Deinobacterium chartae]|uniref:Alanyl-tRNA synthetase n=1 Tax=Deinobacterium chartae TaxID=521158 RepID=A0A841HY04_9DEIO|nr:alanyl-tRNA editing protein [Deinobacterium chartae]MBB6097776.1 alanyl-tRNA synthetase [Deinobacterium chartae]
MKPLYHQQPFATRFRSRVTALEGRRVALEASLFYPEGGGQNADAGELRWATGSARVTDVQKSGGQVWHTLEGDLPTPGLEVEGEIDADRRLRHSQRHTAEHLLAQAFLRVNPAFRVQAVSMRSEECSLDLEGDPTPEDAEAAERTVMNAVYRDLRISDLEVPEAELAHFPLRRPPQVSGRVRLVLVHDPQEPSGYWEVSACGGTHLSSTALAGPIVVLRLERVHGSLTRVFFSAGLEAHARLTHTYRTARDLARSFSSGIDQLTERVEALRASALEDARKLARTQEQLAGFLVHQAPQELLSAGRVRILKLEDEALIKPVSQALTQLPETLGVVYTVSGRLAVTSTLPRPAREVLTEILRAAGGRGGGSPTLAQGSAPAEALAGAVTDWLNQTRPS